MLQDGELETAEKLLSAAEQAFAQFGIDGASIRQINEIAGQRNTSAVRYHFGNKEGLLEVLIERRMGALDEVRAALLASRDASGSKMDLESLVYVLVVPLADRVCRDPSWGCWVRVLNQLVSIRGESYRLLWQREHDRTSREIFRRLRMDLPELPDGIWRQRVSDFMSWVTSSLCERAWLVESGARPALGRKAFVDNLVRTMTAVLSA